ncbi:MAG: methylmalonyl-CoA epimerase [Chloroflexota bacterium]|nr:methylmalonyl-CoA epimerase [Dehalococcoidia bacterium]MDW8253802.1 methylmalonyl-CoA epimerase [Chloroflexota bacterium]
MIQKIHHIAIAVRKIEERMPFYTDQLGLRVREVKEVASEGVRIAFIPCGETLIELVEPLSADHTVARFIEKRGEGLHHICFQTPDIQAEIAGLKGHGCTFVNDEPKLGADGLIAFLHPKSSGGVLVELVQQVESET